MATFNLVSGFPKVNDFLTRATVLWAKNPNLRMNGEIRIEHNGKIGDKRLSVDENQMWDEFFTEDGTGMTIGETIEYVCKWLRDEKAYLKEIGMTYDQWRGDEYMDVTTGYGYHTYVQMRTKYICDKVKEFGGW